LIDGDLCPAAAGDDGTCIGAALAVYQRLEWQRPGSRSGIVISGTSSATTPSSRSSKLTSFPTADWQCSRTAAELLAQNHLVGWFQGRMEFARDAGKIVRFSPPTQGGEPDRVNEAVKFREGWLLSRRVCWRRKASVFSGFQTVALHDSDFWADKDRAGKFRP